MKIIKTQILITVLHDAALPIRDMTLEQIATETDTGEAIGNLTLLRWDDIPADKIRTELLELGNDGTFFENDDPACQCVEPGCPICDLDGGA